MPLKIPPWSGTFLWRWRESNPRPKNFIIKLLQAYLVFVISFKIYPAKRTSKVRLICLTWRPLSHKADMASRIGLHPVGPIENQTSGRYFQANA